MASMAKSSIRVAMIVWKSLVTSGTTSNPIRIRISRISITLRGFFVPEAAMVLSCWVKQRPPDQPAAMRSRYAHSCGGTVASDEMISHFPPLDWAMYMFISA